MIAVYTNAAIDMTGKSESTRHADGPSGFGLKQSTDPWACGVHAAQFSKTAASLATGLAAFAHGQARSLPRGAGEYSAAGASCLGRRAQAPKSPLADLKDPTVEVGRMEIEGIGRDRLAIELDPSL